jgi:monooxygenase
MEECDVIVVGAGISGISAGYHLQRDCPEASYVILEGREALGGTWDLFRYPGVRSDSDMFTLGFAFKPWLGRNAIADGPAILDYVGETAREFGIDQHIRLKHKVVRASWSSEEARWIIDVERDGAPTRFKCKFLLMASGYYDYADGYLPAFAGVDRFKGEIVHPQHWPENLDYAGKRVVVIGSGATAVTLAPAMTDKAAHVVMLQRSPSYVASLPRRSAVADGLRRALPKRLAWDSIRALQIALSQYLFTTARRKPERTKRALLALIREQLPDYDIEKHLTPRYNPWEQRLCLAPDNDLFVALREGKASIVTDTIDTFTEEGIKTSSGEEVKADIIVTATGLNLQMFGGAEISVDGAKLKTGEHYAYKGCMLSDVPNMAFIFGYTNASWTLRADLVNAYVCRVINYLSDYKLVSATPRYDGGHKELPFIDFSSSYFQRVSHLLPKQTADAPWRQNQSYGKDLMDLRFGRIEDGALVFQRAPASAQPKLAFERAAS